MVKNGKSGFSLHDFVDKNLKLVILLLIAVGVIYLFVNRVSNPETVSYGVQSEASIARPPQVNFIYLIPSDKKYNDDYHEGIKEAAENLRSWYGSQLDGLTFTYEVSYVLLDENSQFFQGNGNPGDYWERSLGVGFRETGGFFNDPRNRWVYLIDVENLPNQYAGGTQGVALLTANDLNGLAGNLGDLGRYIGGLGHELGHTFNLPHPADCPSAPHCSTDLMFTGYLIYTPKGEIPPSLTPLDVMTLKNSTDVKQFFRDPAQLTPMSNDTAPKNRTQSRSTKKNKPVDEKTTTSTKK